MRFLFLFALPLLLAVEAFADQPLQPWLDVALPGSVLRLPAGTYRGPAIIDKPLTLEGNNKVIVDADRKSTRLNSSHLKLSRMPSSA